MDESQIHQALSRKRLELDQKLAAYKQQLDAEYTDFERSLHQRPGNSFSCISSSPKIEEDLQIAGLFAPTFLPLLDSRYRFSPPTAAPQQQQQQQQQPPPPPPPPLQQQKMAIGSESTPTSSAALSSARRPSTPQQPLASSLKSDSGSSGKKPKSPKKVSFQFEDDDYVPSRSSPPPAKVVWAQGDPDDDDFEDIPDDEDEEAEVVEEDELMQEEDDDGTTVEQIEHVSVSSLSIHPPPPGVALVTPDQSLLVESPSPPPPQQPPLLSPSFSALPSALSSPPAANPAPFSMPLKDPFAALSSSSRPPPPQQNAHSDDEEDDALFDLDETIPNEPARTPPHRDVDLSPLIAATKNLPPLSSSDRFSLPASSPDPFSRRPPPQPLNFSKSPVGSPPQNHAQPRSSSLSSAFFKARLGGDGAGGAVSSVPAHSQTMPSGSWTTDAARFRRRSITKYIPSPPPEESTLANPTNSDTVDPAILSPYASSFPVTISARTPPASASPANKLPAGTAVTSPYRTKFAQEVAELAQEGGGDGGEAELVVGSIRDLESQPASLKGEGGFSFSMRLAMEDGGGGAGLGRRR